jgi:hypothetical protein
MIKNNKFNLAVLFLLLSVLIFTIQCLGQDEPDPAETEVWEPQPEIVTSGDGTNPPSDAIVLFDGTDLSQWTDGEGNESKWIVKDNAVTVNPETGNLVTRQKFGSCQLHIEFRTPIEVEGDGQGRGNSGIFLQGKYEVQVLDSYNNRTYSNGQAGSIYKQHIPLVNVSRKPGEWQMFDIVFNAPSFNDKGSLKNPGYVTLFHNGVLVLNHVELKGSTVFTGQPKYEAHGSKGPLTLQDHDNPVSYRNIWIREL